jgi:hypothetical protein
MGTVSNFGVWKKCAQLTSKWSSWLSKISALLLRHVALVRLRYCMDLMIKSSQKVINFEEPILYLQTWQSQIHDRWRLFSVKTVLNVRNNLSLELLYTMQSCLPKRTKETLKSKQQIIPKISVFGRKVSYLPTWVFNLATSTCKKENKGKSKQNTQSTSFITTLLFQEDHEKKRGTN